MTPLYTIETQRVSMTVPSSAILFSVSVIRDSSFGTSSSLTFFIPTLYVACKSEVSNPPPITEAPRPDSFKARRRGAALLPMIMSFSSPRAKSSTASI